MKKSATSISPISLLLLSLLLITESSYCWTTFQTGQIHPRSIVRTTTSGRDNAVGTGTALQSSMNDYLSSLTDVQASGTPSSSSPTAPPSTSAATAVAVAPSPQNDNDDNKIAFHHAPLSYFAVHLLTSKGPRANADVGQPHDATRKLVQVHNTQTGSWWCAEGGWPSPNLRHTTEIFYVLSGLGCVTDLDNTKHYFGPGDTVVLPKGWSGRWDVLEDIHKVWVVHDHPHVEESSHPIRAVVVPYHELVPPHVLQDHGVRRDALHGSSPRTASQTIYHAGPSTEVGCWSCTPGSFPVHYKDSLECFFVLEGVFFLTNAANGSAQRCVAGDTVLIPPGWSGQWDVIETVKKLWVVTN